MSAPVKEILFPLARTPNCGSILLFQEVSAMHDQSFPTCREFKSKVLPERPELVRLAPPEMDGFFLARFQKLG